MQLVGEVSTNVALSPFRLFLLDFFVKFGGNILVIFDDKPVIS